MYIYMVYRGGECWIYTGIVFVSCNGISQSVLFHVMVSQNNLLFYVLVFQKSKCLISKLFLFHVIAFPKNIVGTTV